MYEKKIFMILQFGFIIRVYSVFSFCVSMLNGGIFIVVPAFRSCKTYMIKKYGHELNILLGI